jgi:hypothetical protein
LTINVLNQANEVFGVEIDVVYLTFSMQLTKIHAIAEYSLLKHLHVTIFDKKFSFVSPVLLAFK